MAADFFDRTECADAYSPSSKFLAQLNLFDDSMRDGTTVVRRVISLGAGVALPTRRAILVHGEVFLIGGLHIDSFFGEVIRKKYVLHRADGLASVKTADQALRALAGSSLYASRLWVKDLKELEISSRLSSFFSIYAAPNESLAIGSFVLLGGRWHIARNSMIGAAGFLVVEADELPPDALTTAVYSLKSGQVYNPATDVIAPSSSPTVAVLYHRWQDDFVYQRMGAEKFADGDIVAHVSKTAVANAVAGDSFVLNGTTYRVLSVRDDGAGAWTLQGRP